VPSLFPLRCPYLKNSGAAHAVSCNDTCKIVELRHIVQEDS